MSYAIPKQVRTNAKKAAARKEITKSVRDLLSLKLTIPIMDECLKKVHTNQFMWTTLPEKFALENFKHITRGMSSTDNRFGKYQTNKWYIEAVTITNDKGKFEMELDVNPFPSSDSEYVEDLRDWEKAWRDEENKRNDSKSNSNSNSNNSVKSVQQKPLINENNVRKYNIPSAVVNAVKQACAKAASTDLDRAYKWYQWMDKHVTYHGYNGHGRDETTVIAKGGGNCVDNSRLYRAGCIAMGIKCNYVQNTCTPLAHQYNKVYYDNKSVIVDCGRELASWGSNWGGHANCGKETTTSW